MKITRIAASPSRNEAVETASAALETTSGYNIDHRTAKCAICTNGMDQSSNINHQKQGWWAHHCAGKERNAPIRESEKGERGKASRNERRQNTQLSDQEASLVQAGLQAHCSRIEQRIVASKTATSLHHDSCIQRTAPASPVPIGKVYRSQNITNRHRPRVMHGHTSSHSHLAINHLRDAGPNLSFLTSASMSQMCCAALC